ncbi:hypothetical protein ACT2OS_000209 [Enterobacter asburiae]
MSNIDKLKAAAAKAVDNFDPNMFVETRDVLALLDELEAKDRKILKLEKLAEAESVGADKAATSGVEWMKLYHAAEKRIAELERKEQHSERQSVIDALAGSGEEWSDIVTNGAKLIHPSG